MMRNPLAYYYNNIEGLYLKNLAITIAGQRYHVSESEINKKWKKASVWKSIIYEGDGEKMKKKEKTHDDGTKAIIMCFFS